MVQIIVTAPDMAVDTSSDTLVDKNEAIHFHKFEVDEYHTDGDADEEERLLLSSLDSNERRSVGQRLRKVFASPRAWLAISPAILLLLILCSAATATEEWNSKLQSSLEVIQGKLDKGLQTVAGSKASSCEDPWATPGYIWYGDHRFDARWISYNDFQDDVLRPEAAKTIDPEKTGPRPGKEAPHLSELPPHFTKMFSQKAVRKDNPDLEFLRNKHIVVLGSSMDREATMMFCNAYEGAAPADLEWHHSLRCRFPDYNLTISQWMHFGLAETTWKRGGDKLTKVSNFEERVDTVFKAMADTDGKPDLLVFTSGFWDLQYLDAHLHRLDSTHPIGMKYQPMRPDQLEWHRARLVQAIQHLRKTFPDSFLMYRTTSEPDRARTNGDEEGTAVFQLNQSARVVMKMLKVPLFHWAELVKGNHEHRDEHHFNTVSRANAVYHEMLFWHLKQVSKPNVDTTCWLDR